jgi:hypothetical protein
MTPMPTTPRFRSEKRTVQLALAAIATALALGGGCGDLREDELQCEEAVAHLTGCCADFEPRVSCDYQESQACEESIPTDISSEQGRCIRDLSCGDVRRRGLCDADTWQSALSGVCS